MRKMPRETLSLHALRTARIHPTFNENNLRPGA